MLLFDDVESRAYGSCVQISMAMKATPRVELRTCMPAATSINCVPFAVYHQVGGPSVAFESLGLYQRAKSVDLLNFSEQTMWGNAREGSIHDYSGGGSGTVFICDGSRLACLPDASYDFVLGSHFLTPCQPVARHAVDAVSR